MSRDIDNQAEAMSRDIAKTSLMSRDINRRKNYLPTSARISLIAFIL